MKHTREDTSKTADKIKLKFSPTTETSKSEDIVGKCVKICYKDLCLLEDTNKLFDSFEISRQGPVNLLEILKSVLLKLHGHAEQNYCCFYGLFQYNLLPKIFGRNTRFFIRKPFFA